MKYFWLINYVINKFKNRQLQEITKYLIILFIHLNYVYEFGKHYAEKFDIVALVGRLAAKGTSD